jgi:hypothetical protein
MSQQHLPGCPAAQLPVNDQIQKFGLTYTGLRRLLNSAVHLSFSIRSGAGGWSLAPTFTYYPTVDAKNAPAFCMIQILAHARIRVLELSQSLAQWERLVGLVLIKIIKLFQSRKASPSDLDAKNRSLLHYLAISVRSRSKCS